MGDWWISKINAGYEFLKPGVARQFNLALLSPSKNFLRARTFWGQELFGPPEEDGMGNRLRQR
jgi:hypothetical protein